MENIDPLVEQCAEQVLAMTQGMTPEQMQLFWELMGVYTTGFLRGLQGESFTQGYLRKAMADKTAIRPKARH